MPLKAPQLVDAMLKHRDTILFSTLEGIADMQFRALQCRKFLARRRQLFVESCSTHHHS